MMNILIVNQPLNNRGDESAHRCFVKGLNRMFPDANLTILFEAANEDSIRQICIAPQKNRYVNINGGFPGKGRARIRKIALRIGMPLLSLLHPCNLRVALYLRRADLVLCSPGGVCMGPYRDWNHIYLLALAKRIGKKIAYYSRSFGPFSEKTPEDRAFKRISLDLLNSFSFISIRDSKTMDLADSLGLRYHASIDTAFLSRPETTVPSELKSIIGDEYVVFVPNALTWSPDYRNADRRILLQFYVDTAKILLGRFEKAKIVMLPQLFNTNPGSDEDYFQLISKHARNDRIFVLDDQLNSDVQQMIVSGAKLLIGARYHSIVFAINNKIPFVCLSYEHKMSGMLHSLNLDQQNVDIVAVRNGGLDVSACLDQIEAAISSAKSEPSAAEKAKDIADKTMCALADFISGSNKQ